MRCTEGSLRALISNANDKDVGRIFHPFNQRFAYSKSFGELVKLAEALWFLELLAIEIAPIYARAWQENLTDKATVVLKAFYEEGEPRALVCLEIRGGQRIPIWEKFVFYADFPEGSWEVCLQIEEAPEVGIVVVCLLPAEA